MLNHMVLCGVRLFETIPVRVVISVIDTREIISAEWFNGICRGGFPEFSGKVSNFDSLPSPLQTQVVTAQQNFFYFSRNSPLYRNSNHRKSVSAAYITHIYCVRNDVTIRGFRNSSTSSNKLHGTFAFSKCWNVISTKETEHLFIFTLTSSSLFIHLLYGSPWQLWSN